jgi:hypothetical protein
LKLIPCPVCNLVGTLILHGYHSGYLDTTFTIRGRRVICNKRRARNKGCGKSFTIFISNAIRNCTISAESLWTFLGNAASGIEKLKAFRMVLPESFKDKTVFRIYHRFVKVQSAIRSVLNRHSQPPPSSSNDPAQQTIAHLRAIFSSACAISAFQYCFQTSFF